jgi:hypothetical protein
MYRVTRNLLAVGLVGLLAGPALAQQTTTPAAGTAASTTQLNRVFAGLPAAQTTAPVGPGVAPATVPGVFTAQQTSVPLTGPYGGLNFTQPGVPAGPGPGGAPAPGTGAPNGPTDTVNPQLSRFATGLTPGVALGPGVVQVGMTTPSTAFGGVSPFRTTSVAAPGVSTLAGSTSGVPRSNTGIAALGAGTPTTGTGYSSSGAGVVPNGGRSGFAPVSGLAGSVRP